MTSQYNGLRFKFTHPVLDVGGGNGSFLRYNWVKEADIIDLETSENEYNYIKKDITSNFNLNKKYNTIFIMETLEHIKNPCYLLSKVYNLLNDEGTLYISIPYTEIYEGHHHVNRWTKKQILRELSQCGFNAKVIQKRRRFKGLAFFLPYCWLVIEAKKRINNKGGDWNTPKI